MLRSGPGLGSCAEMQLFPSYLHKSLVTTGQQERFLCGQQQISLTFSMLCCFEIIVVLFVSSDTVKQLDLLVFTGHHYSDW